MDWLAYPLGHFLEWAFGLLEILGNKNWININNAFLITGFIGFLYWMKLQAKYNKEAEQNPDQLQ